jgi:hypothetical protein
MGTQTLVSAGIACIIAAIVGGGLKAFGIEIPALNSIKRQLLLAGFGGLLILGGSLGGSGKSQMDSRDGSPAVKPIQSSVTPVPNSCTWDASGAWQINQVDNAESKSFINVQVSQNGKDLTGTAKAVAGTAGFDDGEVEGNIDKTDIKFYIFWKRGPVGEYRGSFDPNSGHLQGAAYDKETKVNTASWSVVHLFACK